MKRTVIGCIAALLVGILGFGCEEWLVGAPCVPETDKGDFSKEIHGMTYAIETRSVQCQGNSMVCLTATRGGEGDDLEQVGDGEEDNYKKYAGTQVKHSFCSCRCSDDEGHKFDRNSDKYDDLCECPSNTKCISVLSKSMPAPENIRGSYCMPNCVYDHCFEDQRCTPSSDSKEPWKWSCK